MKTIENESIRISVQEHGAELSEVYDKKNRRNVIWKADPTFWKRHAPVLFPFVGSVGNGEYRYDGKTYKMSQHGFARDMDFTCIREEKNLLSFELDSNDETVAKYPFNFKLIITYTIDEGNINVNWNVINTDNKKMYFSIGAHPAFNCPIEDGVSRFDCFARFYDTEMKPLKVIDYTLLNLDTSTLNDKDVFKLVTDDGYVLMNEEIFRKGALVFDNNQIGRAELCNPDKKPYLTVTCKEFPSFGLWTKPDSNTPFVCLEPWFGRCDNFGFDGELPEKYGEQCLEAGSEFSSDYIISV